MALAPLTAPLIASVVMLSTFNPKAWVWGFCFNFVIGSLLSYPTTIFLFIPALLCLSRLTILKSYKVCLLGTFLGAVMYLPVTWMMYKSSGPDSGPPEGSYFGFLARSLSDPITWWFPIAGLITAITYCLLPTDSSAQGQHHRRFLIHRAAKSTATERGKNASDNSPTLDQ